MVEEGVYEDVERDVQKNPQADKRQYSKYGYTNLGTCCEKRLRPRLSWIFRCASPNRNRQEWDDDTQ